MKLIGWISLTILFFILGALKLNEEQITKPQLIQKTGTIKSIECRSGAKDGSPTITLTNNGSSSSYKVLEEFSYRTNCDENSRDLIDKLAEVSVLPVDSDFAMAYELYINGSQIYTLKDVNSSNKETAYTLLFVGLIMLGSFIWNRMDKR